ncbi:MAG: glycosyltransferase family 4 protein [Paludibacteraceae bacterium]|nr:glycosyltransferase family 4 protein [Paludibacteraceae bacterium]
MPHITFLAQFPPPMHGLAKAVDTLYNSRLAHQFHFDKIDINAGKVFVPILQILHSKTEMFYFTISQSKVGNLRDVFFLFLIRMKRKKCIIHLHGGGFRSLMERCGRLQRWLNAKAIKNVDTAIVLGDTLRNQFEEFLDSKKIVVVPNCVDNEFVPGSIKDKIDKLHSDDCLNVVYLSNFIRTKGYREVLSIAKKMIDDGYKDRFCFHFAGLFFDEKEEAYFRDVSSSLPNVRYHGAVYGEKKKKMLENGNIFILLTTYPKEGQPISILEGMGNAMLVVTTNHAGIQDIVTESNGLICDKSNINIDLIASYLNQCWTDRNYLANTCESNYKQIVNDFTEWKYIERMEYVFKKISKYE